MKANWRSIVTIFFLVGVFLTALVGTSTSMTFIWPGYFLLGVSGLLMIGFLFQGATFALPRWSTVAVFALLTYVLFRALDSPVAYFAREDVALVVACFLSYAGFLVLCGSSRKRMAIKLTIASLVIVNLCFAVLQTVFGSGIWLLPGYERTSITDVGGLFNQADHYATFLAATVPLWLGLAIFGRESLTMRKIWFAFAILSALGMMLAGSVVGWLTLTVGLGVLFVLTAFVVWRRLKPLVQKRAMHFATLAVLAGSALLFFLAGPIAKVMSRDLLTKEGDASLPLMWEAGVRQVFASPMVGAGSRSSYIYSRVYRPEELASGIGETEFVHNEILQVLGDYGIVGMILLMLVLGLHFRSGFRFIKGYRDYKPNPGELLQKSEHLALAIGAISCLAAIFAASMVDFTIHLPLFALLTAILLAVLAAPDPMSAALTSRQWKTVFPGGSLLFATRTVAFGCGIAMVVFGGTYLRSEYHYEKARIGFEGGNQDFRLMRHLKAARSLDPANPYALSLSAHSQVAAITPDLSIEARKQALEQSERYFSQAQNLYPQDVFAAVGHAAVLDELGRRDEAEMRLQNARKWAPLYGNLMQAEAEHHLRYGDVAGAEKAFRDSLKAGAFADVRAAEQGLKTISEWKFIAMQNGIRWNPEGDIMDDGMQRKIREAGIEKRVLAGEAVPEPEEWTEKESEKK